MPNPGSSTCDLQQAWGDFNEDLVNPEIFLGLEIGNGGQALFRIFFNADCDAGTGALFEPENTNNTDPGDPFVSVSGAEYRVDINGMGNGLTVYELDTSNAGGNDANMDGVDDTSLAGIWTPGAGTGLQAAAESIDTTGDLATCAGSSIFIEVIAPLSTFIADPCLPSCGTLELTTTLSNSGNSPTSSFCQSAGLNIDIDINIPPLADFTAPNFVCEIENSNGSIVYQPITLTPQSPPAPRIY